MNLLAEWKIEHNRVVRRIELYRGDLSRLPDEQAVDLLVVSAFNNDYLPTPDSLIGALERKGVSVDQLAENKEVDLREDFSCWISKPVNGMNFRRILCVESGWHGEPPELADDVFRALAPTSLLRVRHKSVAMPLIGAGDQGYPADQILTAVLRAALAWFGRGISMEVLKIVAYSKESSLLAKKAFLQAKDVLILAGDSFSPLPGEARQFSEHGRSCDVFVSYAHEDSEVASSICRNIQKSSPNSKIFIDRQELRPGSSWLLEIAESLDGARFVVPLFTPRYWSSTYCRDEFTAAFIRQKDTGQKLLFPVYFERSNIPYLFRTLQYQDCREADLKKLVTACKALCRVMR